MRLNDIIYEVYGGIDFAELPDIPFHGIKNAKILLEKIKEGKADYHFSEIMACLICLAHKNPAITRVFETYLGEPYGEKSHNQQFISDPLF